MRVNRLIVMQILIGSQDFATFFQMNATIHFEVNNMQAIDLQTTNDKFLISIDKNSIDKEFLLNLIEKIRLEYLVRKVDFDESIEDLGEEIKADWWQKNKDKFIKP
jgi:hypothetical protein